MICTIYYYWKGLCFLKDTEMNAFLLFCVMVLVLLLLYCSYRQRTDRPGIDLGLSQECNPEKATPICTATEIGKIVLELSKLAVKPESDETSKQIILLGRKLDYLPRISLNSNLVYAFRTILEFLEENDAQKVAKVWEKNGWDVRKWMAEDLYRL